MTVSINTLGSGLRANSELTQAALAAYQRNKPGIIEMIWKWLIGESENSDDFKMVLPFIFHALEQQRTARTDGLKGQVRLLVWLSSKKCLAMEQSPNGLTVTAKILTAGGCFAPSFKASSLEVVNGDPGTKSTFEQLHLKLAKEVHQQFGASTESDPTNVSVFHGFASQGGNSTSRFTIDREDLLLQVRRIISESLAEGLQRVIAIDEELALQAQLVELRLSTQLQGEAIQHQAELAFRQRTPDAATIEAVRQAIQRRFDPSQGSSVWEDPAGDRLDFDGQDLLSPITLAGSDQETEWCLLRTGNKTYGLTTAPSAIQLLNRPSRINPYTREPLTEASFIRGQRLLDWLDATTNPVSAEPL